MTCNVSEFYDVLNYLYVHCCGLFFPFYVFFCRKLKMAVAVFITLVVCGIIVYFLFPRTPTLELISASTNNVSLAKKQDPYIVLKVTAIPNFLMIIS